LGLSDRFRCIAVSRFGYLRSPVLGDASPLAQADAYAALLKALDVPHVGLVGGSTGGPSCLQFALRYPDRCTALILISALSRAWAWPTIPPIVQGMMLHSGLVFWALVNFAPLVLLAAFGISRQALAQAGLEEKARVREILQTLLPTHLRWMGMANDANELARIDRYPLEHIAAPTLVIHAVDDVLAPFAHGQFTAEAIPDARLLRLNSGGHLWLRQREKIVAAIAEFLQT
jgi:pimeloyl-ACP methyl ester carboxylesterase